MYYDIILVFIKLIWGSDFDGVIYWLVCMVEGGEDLVFIVRCLVIFVVEDIGLVNLNVLLLVNVCFDILMKIGWLEGRILLVEIMIYLVISFKSNLVYNVVNDVLVLVCEIGNLFVFLYLCNVFIKLMK